MWLFTTSGFFSVVRKAHKDAPARPYQIRARSVADLRLLVKRCAVPRAQSRIIETPGADYCARIAVTGHVLSEIMLTLAADVDYENFKGAMAATKSQADKSDSLHDVWSVMWRYQEGLKGRTEIAAPARHVSR